MPQPLRYNEGWTYNDPLLRFNGFAPDSPVFHRPTTQPKSNRTMASNALPDDKDALFALAEDMADGLNTHGAAIGVVQHTEAKLRADLAGSRGADLAYGASKGATSVKDQAVTDADAAAILFLGRVKKRYAAFFGDRWSPAWEATGFPDQSTAVPRTQDKRFALLAATKSYLATNPTKEDPTPELLVTAAEADARHTAVSDARKARDQADANQTSAKNLSKTTEVALRKRLRGCIDELTSLLAADDPRWHALGLSLPSDPDTPEQGSPITLTNPAPHSLLLTWPRVRRAERYRVLIQVVGTDTDFRIQDTVHDLTLLISGLTTGATVRLKVVPGNTAGDGPESPVVEGVVS